MLLLHVRKMHMQCCFGMPLPLLKRKELGKPLLNEKHEFTG